MGTGVDAVHPGYGFLSEREAFANACKENGITFVGPTVEQLNTFGDKTKARELAIRVGVPVVPGTDGPVSTLEQARAFIDSGVGYPVIIKVRVTQEINTWCLVYVYSFIYVHTIE